MAKNILIVEDNMIIALDIKEKIKNLGHTVPAIVSSGEQAIKITEELNPDLIIMDIGLKGNLNGIETGKIIRERFNIPLIYLTGNGNLHKQANITDPCIDKPFNDEELKKLINKLLDNQPVN
ncbi:MAG TPA: response regulator [Ignavibacteriaceae bacterium]|nr:response regulator [Ignavibacteriaceae bacterium]